MGTRTVMVLVKYHVDVLKIKYRYKNTYKYQATEGMKVDDPPAKHATREDPIAT